VLSDILGSEDALGDMDFKVAGDEEGITAFQMDIKVEGITLDIMRNALQQAKQGRTHILGEMRKCMPAPRNALSDNTPRILRLKVNPKYNGELIGPGGKNIKKMMEDHGVFNIDLNNDGDVTVFGPAAGAEACVREIEAKTEEPVVGKVYEQVKVKNVVDFGMFVEILPGKDALVHVSEISNERVNAPGDLFKTGDIVDVKLIEINNRGQLRCSRKVLLEPEEPAPKPPRPEGRDEPRAEMKPKPKPKAPTESAE